MAEALHACAPRCWKAVGIARSWPTQNIARGGRSLAGFGAIGGGVSGQLTQAGLVDVHDVRRAAADTPELPDVRRVVMLGVTDISPVIEQTLTRLMDQGVQVQLVCFGLAVWMTGAGRCLNFWNGRSLLITENHLVPALDERAQAEAAVAR